MTENVTAGFAEILPSVPPLPERSLLKFYLNELPHPKRSLPKFFLSAQPEPEHLLLNFLSTDWQQLIYFVADKYSFQNELFPAFS